MSSLDYGLEMLQPFETFKFEAANVEFIAIQPALGELPLYAFGTVRGTMFAKSFMNLEDIFKWLVDKLNEGTPVEDARSLPVHPDEVDAILAYVSIRCQHTITRGDDVISVIKLALDLLRDGDYFPNSAAEESWDYYYGSSK